MRKPQSLFSALALPPEATGEGGGRVCDNGNVDLGLGFWRGGGREGAPWRRVGEYKEGFNGGGG